MAAMAATAAVAGCARAHPAANDPQAPCASLAPDECRRARGLVAAASTYDDEPHAFLLATRDLATGRGVARGPAGDRSGVRGCAAVTATAVARDVDVRAVEYGFVGAAVDATLLSADADVAPLLAEGDHVIRLVAMALVRDTAHPAITPGPALKPKEGACACGDATHVLGEARWGALVSYEAPAPRVRRATRALDLVRAVLGDPKTHVKVTRLGVLAVDGLAPYVAGRAARPVAFRVTKAAPIAYALRPLADACPNAFPAPDVVPTPVDFGVATYGTEARGTVRVVNRASFDLDALLGVRTVRIAARSETNLPLAWTPTGDAWACETQTRDEAIRFLPSDPSRTALPREQVVRVLETVRTGRPTLTRAEHVEPTARAAAGATERDWACPPDFVPSACRIERSACTVAADPAHAVQCADVRASVRANGCHLACKSENGGICRFDATLECRLRCPDD
jgi:hypothetical protein